MLKQYDPGVAIVHFMQNLVTVRHYKHIQT